MKTDYSGDKRVILMFSGQGPDYYQMGRDLYEHHPVFANWMRRGDEVVEDVMGYSVVGELYGARHRKSEAFSQTLKTHPAIYMVEYALAKVVQSQGIEVDGILGASLGEIVGCIVGGCMLEKYQKIFELASNYDISMQTYHAASLSIIPLLGWYDFSFGQPSSQLLEAWMDFRACVWSERLQMPDVTEYFLNKNRTALKTVNQTLISFSHFLPRIDLMPAYIPSSLRYLYPVLGSEMIEEQIRQLKPQIHVYGHSHVNCQMDIKGIKY